jgi:hypothetical protein
MGAVGQLISAQMLGLGKRCYLIRAFLYRTAMCSKKRSKEPGNWWGGRVNNGVSLEKQDRR